MTTQPDVMIFDEREWADHAAGLFQEMSEPALRSRGRLLLALSGGSTPRRLYQTVAHSQWKQRFDWQHMAFLFGDERCVPPDHPESNYGLAETELFQPLGIGSEQIYRMKGESADASAAAREYEETIRAASDSPAPAVPQLDLIFLGLGDDGHTASLFPGTAALGDRTHLVAVGHSPKGIRLRLTLTLGVINQASVVLFLVTGGVKAEVVRRVLEPKTDAERQLPAALVRPVHGRLIWLLDEPAAAALTGPGTHKKGSI